jgi:5'-phosphate synthase pdxT subunit
VKRIGVLAVQGDVSEHQAAVGRAAAARGERAEAVGVRRPEALEGLHALVLPGGESTTISKMLHRNGLFEPVRSRAAEGSLALLGTCAGMIVMAKGGGEQVARTRTGLLGLMDIDVERNAFGRQRESFEADLPVEGYPTPMHAVFIRAPAVRSASGRTRVLARVGKWGVFAVEDNLIATAFHPELTADTRVHELLLALV